MARQLTREDVATRLKNYQRDGYLYIGGFMKSVTFAAGTIVLIEILSHETEIWLRLPLWIVSLMATLLSYLTWGRGTLLINSRGNLQDAVLPLFMGITEFLLFALLSFGSIANETAWRWWFAALAADFFIGALITWNREKITHLTEDFAPDIRNLGKEMAQWVQNDRRGAVKGLILAGPVACIAPFVPDPWQWVYPASSVFFAIFFGRAIKAANRQRERIEEIIFEKPKTRSRKRSAPPRSSP